MKLKELLKSKKVFPACISLILIAALFITALFAGWLDGPAAPSSSGTDQADGTGAYSGDASITLTPLAFDKTGIDLLSDFKLVSDRSLQEDAVNASLRVSPSQNYSIRALSEKEYLVHFDQPLVPDSIYTFEYTGDSEESKHAWAFQTKKAFRVVKTLPRNRTTYIPLNSGIEITFSHDKVKDIDQYFEISPKVSGRFEWHKKTLVFVPEKLSPGTIYTVTLKKGLGIEGSEDVLEEDVTFSFQTEPETQKDQYNYLHFSSQLYSLTAKTAPVLQVYTDEATIEKEVGIELYRYSSEEAFIQRIKENSNLPFWAVYDSTNKEVDTSELEQVSSFKTKVVRNAGDYWNPTLVCFPEALPEGYYLVKCTSKEFTEYTHLQINNASVYILAGTNQTLAWVNDSVSGKPIEGSVIKVDGQPLEARTNAEGIAVIDKPLVWPENARYAYIQVMREGKPSFWALVENNGSYIPYQDYDYYGFYGDRQDDYWTYMYMDKGIYLPSDTVNLWGVLKPRTPSEVNEKVSLELFSYNYFFESSPDLSSIAVWDAELSPAGTFESSLKLPNLNPGYYNIRLMLNGKAVMQRSFHVEAYEKPAYQLEATPDDKALFAWEKTNVSIQASFFEGSPVSGLELNYSYGLDAVKTGKIVCDKNGSASLEIASHTSSTSWQPQYHSFHISSAGAEETPINGYCSMMVFPRDTMLEVQSSSKKGSTSIQVDTHRIDLSALRKSDKYHYDPALYRGRPADIPLKAEIYERHWDKEEAGEYYDYINKKVVKKYRYFEVENLIQQFDFTPSDGKYQFDFPTQDNKSYTIKITGSDSRGQKLSESVYIYGSSYWWDAYDMPTYKLERISGNETCKTGEAVTYTVKLGDQEVTKGENRRFLHLTLHKGIQEADITDSPRYTAAFTADRIPSMYIKSVYFDGSELHDLYPELIKYDAQEKRIDIRIDPDKPLYKPGELVHLDILTEDSSGKPCSAEVNLSVVDEAFFALEDQYVDTLGALYGPSVSAGILASYVSHEPLQDMVPANGAEQGEGGDKIARSDFRDNAYFSSVHTDAQGKASVSFKLPDNLTSWRVTYQGVTPDLEAGSGKINIVSTLSFFVDTIFHQTLLENDSPDIGVRAYGTQLDPGAEVSYKVTVQNSTGDKKIFETKGKANQRTNIRLDKLTEGRYTVTVEASSGNLRDVVEKEFQVVKHILEASRVKHDKLTEGFKPEGSDGLTTLTFYNGNSSRYYQELSSLAGSWGQRIDQVLSRILGWELMKKYYGEEPWYEEETDLSKYQTEDGGIALLSYDSSDVELSAKICGLAAEHLDTTALKLYFYNTINDPEALPEQVCAAYMGLASLREPILIEIQELVGSERLGIKEKLYLSAALAELGDFGNAKALFSEIYKSYGKTIGELYYIDPGTGDKDDILELTALGSITAIKSGLPEKDGMFDYVCSKSSSDILTNLERLTYVRAGIPTAKHTGKFSYSIGDERKEVVINGGESYRLVLTPERLDAISFTNIEGDLRVTTRYTGSITDLMQAASPAMQIKRNIGTDNGQSFATSDLVTITLNIQLGKELPNGYYEITDVLPAGFRFDHFVYSHRSPWQLEQVNRQKVVLGAYLNPGNSGTYTITYVARAVNTGSFTADHAVLRHNDSDASAFSDQSTVVIH